MITRESPDTADARALIAELDAELEPLYARESRHGFSVDKLIAEGVAFFVLRHEGTPAGCGGVKLIDGDYAEVKRMYVRPAFRGKGLAQAMLDHLTSFARDRGFALLRLETGIHQHAAIRMYERSGFRSIGPFGDYVADPVSLFYEKQLR
jgi:putative acetyltransferase